MNPATANNSSERRAFWLMALGVGLITLAVFSPSWSAEFLKWDDDINITRNTRIQNLGSEELKWMFTDVGLARRYMPLGWLGFAIHHAIFGMNAHSYHVVNTILFSLCAILLFSILYDLLRCVPENGARKPHNSLLICAAFGTLAWSVHPLRVEVVAWASGRLYLQAAFFLLIAMFTYLRSQESEAPRGRRRILYWTAVASFAISLLIYPIALPFPLALLAMDILPLRRFKDGLWSASARSAVFGKIPFILVMLGVFAATLYARAHGTTAWQAAPTLEQFSLDHRVMQAFYVWAWYCWKAIWPVGLTPVYADLISFSPGDIPFIGSLVGIVAITLFLVWRGRRWPAAFLLWIVYLGWLVPLLGLTEHPHFASDRYSILAHLALAAAVSIGLLKLSQRPNCVRCAYAAAAILVVFCGVLTVRQTRVWQTSETLFRHMAKALGNDPYRADILWRLGEVLAQKNQFDEAVAAYEESLCVDPRNPQGYNGIGEVLAQQGRWREALAQFTRATDVQPGFLRALNNIAWTLATAGDATVRNGRMALDLARALDERSGVRNAQFLESLAAAYAETGQFNQAVATAEKIPAMAKLSGEYEVAARNESLLALYRAGQPFRQQPR